MITPKSLATNFTIQALGKISAVLVGLFAIALMTRTLGTEGFGEYTTAITFLQMFGVVVDFGLTLTLIVMISKAGANEEEVVGNFFGLRLISGFLLFNLAPITVLFFPWSTTVKQAVLVGALAYFLMGGATMLIGIFQKHEAMWRAAIAELVNRIVLVAFVALFAFGGMGVVAMVVASAIANAVWLVMMIFLAKPFVHVSPMFDFSFWKKIISKSWPIAISIIFNLLYLKGDILFLSFFHDQSTVGIYGVSYRIIDVLTVMPVMFMGLLLPSMVQAWTSGNKQEFKRRVSKTFDLFMMAVIPIVVGTQIVGVPLVELIAGNRFTESGLVLNLLILALIGVFLGALYGHLVVALDKQRPMIWGYISVAIVSITGYFLFIPTYGMWGAVWVTLFSEALIAIITFLVVYKVSGALPNLIVAIKAIVAAAVMYFALSVLPATHVLLDIMIGAVVYLFVMLLIKGIRPQEIKSLISHQQI